MLSDLHGGHDPRGPWGTESLPWSALPRSLASDRRITCTERATACACGTGITAFALGGQLTASSMASNAACESCESESRCASTKDPAVPVWHSQTVLRPPTSSTGSKSPSPRSRAAGAVHFEGTAPPPFLPSRSRARPVDRRSERAARTGPLSLWTAGPGFYSAASGI
jgi:hypothetical protein